MRRREMKKAIYHANTASVKLEFRWLIRRKSWLEVEFPGLNKAGV
jgi:hypothetical protein